MESQSIIINDRGLENNSPEQSISLRAHVAYLDCRVVGKKGNYSGKPRFSIGADFIAPIFQTV